MEVKRIFLQPGHFIVTAGLAGATVLGAELERRKLGMKVKGQRLGGFTSAYLLLAPVFIVAFFGAKIGGVLDNLESFRADPMGYFTDPSEHAFYGAFVFGLLALYIAARATRIPLRSFLDSLAPALMIGYAIGRIGCHVTGDGCYGIPTDSFLGVTYSDGLVPTLTPVYPTPLYECGAALLIFILLWSLRKRTVSSGMLFSLCITLYAVERFLVEFIRHNHRFGPFSQAQWISLVVFSVGVVLLYRGLRKGNTLAE